jgi:hypothetical protein
VDHCSRSTVLATEVFGHACGLTRSTCRLRLSLVMVT